MHGVTKADLTEERKKLIAKNIKLYKELNAFVLSQKKKKNFSEGMLLKCSKVLSINCEHYTVWNYRREILLHLFENDCESESERGRLLKRECAEIEKTLQRNPKSYSSFHHRVWCIQQDKFGAIALSKELRLCSDFLAMDSRNFHCWDYRRFVVEKCRNENANKLKEELKYSKQLIVANFSNYSAWHYRSTLIPIICRGNGAKLKKRILRELEFVKNAFYTEPNDQSAWLYHRWLLGMDGYSTSIRSEKMMSNCHEYRLSIDELKNEFDAIAEFLTIEPLAKWGLLTYCVLMQALKARNYPIADAKEKCNDAFKTLIAIDAIRKNYYLDIQDTIIKQLS